jgi:AcrR family transcriptional regulator
MNRDSKHEAPVRPLRERLRTETARAISEAAEQVFARRGVRDARMEEIAARAGVSVGTVYNHFEDRETLLRELIERRRQALAKKLDRALEESRGEPFEAQLRSFTATVLEHFEANRPFLAITLQSDSASLEQPSEAMRELRARAETLVRRGLDQRALRPQERELWTTLLFGVLRAALVHELRHPSQAALGDRAAALADFFLRGARP